MKIFCKWFGHRWIYDGWWKVEGGWIRHRTCKRCECGETFKTNTENKPLDVVQT